MLDVLVLGPVVARADGRDRPVRGPTQRALLARLAVARGHPLTPEQLIGDLWDDAPPRDPGHALQARISRLRADLPLRIELQAGGYRLDPATTRTDSVRFETLKDRGMRLLAEADLVGAGECLHEALGLWRGPALGGLPDVPALKAEAVRLEKLRTTALADRVDVDLALDRCTEIIPELHALVEHYPLAERSWAQLMTALYCAGLSEEALGVFARARALFADHLGIEPSGRLARLHVAILRGDPPRSLLRRPARAVVDRPGDDAARIRWSEAASPRSEARRRAHLLALDLGGPVDEEATLDVAEYALGASDERLALRAAMAVVAESPDSVHAHRVAGLAASSLGLTEVADAHLETARQCAATDAEHTAVAQSTARHRARMRWAAVPGRDDHGPRRSTP